MTSSPQALRGLRVFRGYFSHLNGVRFDEGKEIGMKTIISGIIGLAGGLILAVPILVQVEFKTGRCIAYHYDKVFHPEYIVD